MNFKKLQTCDQTKLERLSKFQLPHFYKRVGITIVGIGFLTMLTLKFVHEEPHWVRQVVKQAILVGLLIISLSKEKIEDELIDSLRSKSYALAFIVGVVYTMLLPLVNYVINFILNEHEPTTNIGYFQVLLFMLLIQVMFFEVLKRNR